MAIIRIVMLPEVEYRAISKNRLDFLSEMTIDHQQFNLLVTGGTRASSFMKHMLFRLACAPLALLGLVVNAGALTPSCQADLDKHGSARLEAVQKINAFGKKRPTPKQACSAFSDLVKIEADMLKWMQDNQDWCQLPEPLVTDFKKATAQAIKVRGQACTAARRPPQQRQATPRAPAGGGVQLPKGAL
jgi:hypothetical protein